MVQCPRVTNFKSLCRRTEVSTISPFKQWPSRESSANSQKRNSSNFWHHSPRTCFQISFQIQANSSFSHRSSAIQAPPWSTHQMQTRFLVSRHLTESRESTAETEASSWLHCPFTILSCWWYSVCWEFHRIITKVAARHCCQGYRTFIIPCWVGVWTHCS